MLLEEVANLELPGLPYTPMTVVGVGELRQALPNVGIDNNTYSPFNLSGAYRFYMEE